MDDLHRYADKVATDLKHLEYSLQAVYETEELTEEHFTLPLSIAKRGRRNLTLLIKALADERDTATANGGTSE